MLQFYHWHVVEPGEVISFILSQSESPFCGVEVEAMVLAAWRPVKAAPSHHTAQ